MASLTARGFDRGERGCSQCEALSINGVACHETGCPNAMHECEECETLLPRGYRLCDSCAGADDDGMMVCRECGAPVDDGEGWDGYCGSCADKRA